MISHVSSQLDYLQFGFLRGMSSTSQLFHVLQEFHKALESRSQIDSVYLDFAKAFDKVSHNLLLGKPALMLAQSLSAWPFSRSNIPQRDLEYTLWVSTL